MTSEPELKKLVWESWLQAVVNQQYWTAMARRYRRKEQIANIFVAICSSFTVMTWLVDQKMEWLRQLLSIASAIVAASLSILNYSNQVATMAELATKWAYLRFDYERLWLSFPIETTDLPLGEFSKLRNKESELVAQEARLPKDDKLYEQIRDDVSSKQGNVNIFPIT